MQIIIVWRPPINSSSSLTLFEGCIFPSSNYLALAREEKHELLRYYCTTVLHSTVVLTPRYCTYRPPPWMSESREKWEMGLTRLRATSRTLSSRHWRFSADGSNEWKRTMEHIMHSWVGGWEAASVFLVLLRPSTIITPYLRVIITPVLSSQCPASIATCQA